MSRPKKDATATAEPKVKRTAADILADAEKLNEYRREKLAADNVLSDARKVWEAAVLAHAFAVTNADRKRKGEPPLPVPGTEAPAITEPAALEQPEGGA